MKTMLYSASKLHTCTSPWFASVTDNRRLATMKKRQVPDQKGGYMPLYKAIGE